MSEINSNFIRVNDAHLRFPRRRGEGEEGRNTPLAVARTPDEHALEAMLAGAIELTAEKSVVESEQSSVPAAAESRQSVLLQQPRAAQWSDADDDLGSTARSEQQTELELAGACSAGCH